MQYRRITIKIHHCSIPSIVSYCTHEEYQSPYEIGKDNRGGESDSSRISMLHMDSTSLPNVWKHRREKEKCYLEQSSTSVQTTNNNKITGDRGEYRTLGFHTLRVTIKNATFNQVYKNKNIL